MTNPALDYIRENWSRSFYKDVDGSGFLGDDQPYPYTSPCISDKLSPKHNHA